MLKKVILVVFIAFIAQQGVSSGPITDLIASLNQRISELVDTIGNVVDNAMATVKQVQETLNGTLTGLSNRISNTLGGVNSLVERLTNEAAAAGKNIDVCVQNEVNALTGITDGIFDNCKIADNLEVVTNAVQGTSQLVVGLLQAPLTCLGNILDVSGCLQNIIKTTEDELSGLNKLVSQTVGQTLSTAQTCARGATSGVIQTINKVREELLTCTQNILNSE